MAELPASTWTDEQFLEWLKPSFDWLAEEQWAPQEEKENEEASYPTWEQTKDGFLGKLEVQESELETTAELRVLQLLVWHVDEDLYSDDDRREFLLDEHERESKLSELVAQWQGELETADDAAQPAADGASEAGSERTFVEGRGWMRLDPERNEWVDVEDPAAAPTGEQAVSATAESVSTAIADQVATPALQQLLAARPDLAGLPQDELQALVGSVIAARLAAAS